MVELLDDPFFEVLKQFIVGSTGLAFYTRRDKELAGHVARRLEATGLSDCATYLARLKQPGPGEMELDTLVAGLTIGETYFFRYTEQFAALRDVILPHLIQKNRHLRQLSIWSAGCATGPEPYSLSILLRRDMAHQVEGWDIRIMGTDINRDFLARAQSGVYPEWAFRGVPEDVRRDCFVRTGAEWRIEPRYQGGVVFRHHNLVRDPLPDSGFDLILCRNVFIYFDTDTLESTLQQFHQGLADEGWLLVGHAESHTDLFKAFRTVTVPGAILYQKAPPEPRPFQDLPFAWAEATVPTPSGAPALDDLARVRDCLDRGDWATAERACRDLLETHRLDAELHFHLALAQQEQGQTDLAEHSLRQALYLDRGYVLAHYHLGLLLEGRADRSGAVRSFRNAMRLLRRMPAEHVLAGTTGWTVASLQEVAAMHLKVL